jgi:hypothetical protein
MSKATLEHFDSTRKPAKKQDFVSFMKSFKFDIVPYNPDQLADFLAAEKNHNILRVTAILAKKVNADELVVRDVTVRADEAFLRLLGFIAVQCPYCNSIMDEVGDEHLLQCTSMQQKYDHASGKWNLTQCKSDFPDRQLVSWSLQHQRNCLASALASASAASARQTPRDARPAVVDKKRNITPLAKRIEMPQRIQPGKVMPAVTMRKHAYDPKKAGWNR